MKAYQRGFIIQQPCFCTPISSDSSLIKPQSAAMSNIMAEYELDHYFSQEEDYTKGGALDFLSFQSNDVAAPHPDQFESELDSSLAGLDLELSIVSNDFTFLQSIGGPLSGITVSSESYDSISSHSASQYNYTASDYSISPHSFPLDHLDMDFQRVALSEYGTPLDNDFGTLPPTPPSSPPVPLQTATKAYEKFRTSYSEYAPPPKRGSVPSDYYSQYAFSAAAIPQSTVSPSHISTQPLVPSIPVVRPPPDEYKGEQRNRKYKCTVCTRGKLCSIPSL